MVGWLESEVGRRLPAKEVAPRTVGAKARADSPLPVGIIAYTCYKTMLRMVFVLSYILRQHGLYG